MNKEQTPSLRELQPTTKIYLITVHDFGPDEDYVWSYNTPAATPREALEHYVTRVLNTRHFKVEDFEEYLLVEPPLGTNAKVYRWKGNELFRGDDPVATFQLTIVDQNEVSTI